MKIKLINGLKMFKSILCILLVCSNALAEDVVHLTKGAVAPYTGYLFPDDQAQDMKNKLQAYYDLNLQLESYKRSVELYSKNEVIYQKQLDLLSVQNDKLVNTTQQSLSMSNYEKFGYFALGILATGLAVYSAKKIITN